MKKKAIVTLSSVTSIFIILIITSFIFGWPIEQVRITGREAIGTAEEYNNYYLMAGRRQTVPEPEPWGSFVRNFYFLPGQKDKMLDRIRADVIADLDLLI